MKLLSEGLKLQLQIDQLQISGKFEEHKAAQSHQKRLDAIYTVLSKHPEVERRDYRRVITNIRERQDYLQTLPQWKAKLDDLLPSPIPSLSLRQHKEITQRIQKLTHDVARKHGADKVHGVAQARARCRVAVHASASEPETIPPAESDSESELEEGEIRGTPSPAPQERVSGKSQTDPEAQKIHGQHNIENLDNFKETLAKMKDHEAACTQAQTQTTARLSALDTQLSSALALAQPIGARLRGVDTSAYPRAGAVLAGLGSDAVAEKMQDALQTFVQTVLVVSTLKVLEAASDTCGRVWAGVAPSFAVVDELELQVQAQARQGQGRPGCR
ncbi:hypothetical protein H0H81_004939 [Sphagnurus paluster]|uniref:Uncharacterized protein n=1 Tax=Sphagnurus paluster TaxID=117069 RepID=A0A9P7FW92_9AGAR|nr:hypothetical protein H0H81_004939 [Sphagnurus paluster]